MMTSMYLVRLEITEVATRAAYTTDVWVRAASRDEAHSTVVRLHSQLGNAVRLVGVWNMGNQI